MELTKQTLQEEDRGFNEPTFFCCFVLNNINKIHNIKIPEYEPDGFMSNDYFEKTQPTKEDFLKFLGLENSQDGFIVTPVTVKDHYSTLFIDLKNNKMLCLFDSGLGHSEEKEVLNTEEIEEYEEILQFTDPIASEYVFGKNLAKDIICLNNYCLQDEQSCGYWTIAACKLGTSEEYNDIDKIIKDCNNGIFQIKLAKKVLEITDDIVKGNKQNIILINPTNDHSFNKNEYTEYKKDNDTVFIRNINSKNIIGVDLDLLKQQMKEKRFTETSTQLQPDTEQIKPIIGEHTKKLQERRSNSTSRSYSINSIE